MTSHAPISIKINNCGSMVLCKVCNNSFSIRLPLKRRRFRARILSRRYGATTCGLSAEVISKNNGGHQEAGPDKAGEHDALLQLLSLCGRSRRESSKITGNKKEASGHRDIKCGGRHMWP